MNSTITTSAGGRASLELSLSPWKTRCIVALCITGFFPNCNLKYYTTQSKSLFCYILQAITLLRSCLLRGKQNTDHPEEVRKQRIVLLIELAKHKRDQSTKMFQNEEADEARNLRNSAFKVLLNLI